MARTRTHRPSTAAYVGFEASLWAIADALRGTVEAADYMHVTLGLLMMKRDNTTDIRVSPSF